MNTGHVILFVVGLATAHADSDLRFLNQIPYGAPVGWNSQLNFDQKGEPQVPSGNEIWKASQFGRLTSYVYQGPNPSPGNRSSFRAHAHVSRDNEGHITRVSRGYVQKLGRILKLAQQEVRGDFSATFENGYATSITQCDSSRSQRTDETPDDAPAGNITCATATRGACEQLQRDYPAMEASFGDYEKLTKEGPFKDVRVIESSNLQDIKSRWLKGYIDAGQAKVAGVLTSKSMEDDSVRKFVLKRMKALCGVAEFEPNTQSSTNTTKDAASGGAGR